MPFTPFHLGPALFFGLLLLRHINLPAFLIANIIVDIEPFLALFLGLDYPLHGFFHSILGGAIIAALLSLAMTKLNERVRKLMTVFMLGQELPAKSIWLASFSGIYLHIALDSFLYTDIKPLCPFSYNPLYTLLSPSAVYSLCAIFFLGGILLYGYRLVRNKYA